MELSEQLKEEAIGLGLCGQWQKEWADGTDRHELIKKYIRGIDFCIGRDWPSKELIKEKFGDIIHEHGIYVDEEVFLDNTEGTYVFLGHCTGTIVGRDYSVSDIYVLHDSALLITARDFSKVFVNASEQSEINTVEYGGAKLRKYTIKTGEYNGK